MKLLPFVLALLLWCPTPSVAAENPYLAFVSEYVRELGANEKMREQGERELAEPNADQLAVSIRSSTRIVMELSAQIGILKGTTLNEPFDKLPQNIADFYKYKIDAHQQLIDIATAMMAGPKPGVDYGAMAARAPKLTAMVEYVDRAIFEATPMIFGTLIDKNPDKDGHMSRLNITRAQRDELIRKLQISFGKKMDQKDQNYLVSSASVLRDYLSKKGYKCSDDPL
ncbi:MAG TPA: hypothetical protein VEK73_10945 [Xanthobacteraceae bacterium]|nr:hypothetical protein [Xanthobacteraceae bacterium]